MDLQFAYHLYKLFFLFEAFENFALKYATDTIPFLFARRISSYCFIISAASSGFCTFLASLFKSSISTTLLMVMDSLNCLSISSLLRRFVFLLFPEFPHSYKQKITAIPKILNTLYNKNATPLSTKHVLFDMMKGCKTTSSPTFSQNCFSDQAHGQENLKKPLLN